MLLNDGTDKKIGLRIWNEVENHSEHPGEKVEV